MCDILEESVLFLHRQAIQVFLDIAKGPLNACCRSRTHRSLTSFGK